MDSTQPIVIPGACKGVKEFKIVRWHKKPGDRVKRGELLLEIETSKAVLEIESPHTGILLEILVPPNQTVSVASPLAHVG